MRKDYVPYRPSRYLKLKQVFVNISPIDVLIINMVHNASDTYTSTQMCVLRSIDIYLCDMRHDISASIAVKYVFFVFIRKSKINYIYI